MGLSQYTAKELIVLFSSGSATSVVLLSMAVIFIARRGKSELPIGIAAILATAAGTAHQLHGLSHLNLSAGSNAPIGLVWITLFSNVITFITFGMLFGLFLAISWLIKPSEPRESK